MTPDFMDRIDAESRRALTACRADPGVALLVDTMASMHICTSSLEDVVAGALLEAEEPATIGAAAFDDVLSRIDAQETENAQKRAALDAADGLSELIRLPEPLREAVLEAAGAKGWKFGGPGIRQIDLDLGGDTEVQLMRLKPGQAVPTHTHGGREYTLCLEGGFSDERGSYGPGELSVADHSVTHTPIADDGEACIVLAVTDAGLKFTGLLGVLQRIFRQ